MKITEKMKEQLQKAKDKEYRRIYVIVGTYKATTYCNFISIDELLAQPVGTNYKTSTNRMKWTGWPNTRQVTKTDIQYSELMEL